jgi:hypothetical protein
LLQSLRKTSASNETPGDWSAGILACNAAWFSGVKRRQLDLPALLRVEATLMQARMPALQSVGVLISCDSSLMQNKKAAFSSRRRFFKDKYSGVSVLRPFNGLPGLSKDAVTQNATTNPLTC